MAAFHPLRTFTRRRTVPKLSPPNGRRSSDDTSMGKDILLLGDGFPGCEPYPLNQAQKVAYSLGAGDPRSEAIRLLDGHDRKGSCFPLVFRTRTRLRSFELDGCLTHGSAFHPFQTFRGLVLNEYRIRLWHDPSEAARPRAADRFPADIQCRLEPRPLAQNDTSHRIK